MKTNLFLICFLAVACQSSTEDVLPKAVLVSNKVAPVGNFRDYWYKGQGEVNSYALEQERYGELRTGDAVLVFVTEELSRTKQVKLDKPEAASTDRVEVLKCNAMRKFATGIYDYSLMNSVFTPVNIAADPHSVKLTCSVQDWCGQVFHQFNWRGNAYDAKSFSYFEAEADAVYNVNTHLLEDELWNRIRIDPTTIPTRKLSILPGMSYLSMKHKPIKPIDAGIINSQIDEVISQIEVVYPTIQRSLRIQYETKFPHKIVGWEEQNGKDPITKATLKTSVMTTYWNQSKTTDKPIRAKLNLVWE